MGRAHARSLELTGTHDGFYLSYKVGPAYKPQRLPGAGPRLVGWVRRAVAILTPLLVDMLSIRAHPCALPHPGPDKPSCLLAQQNRGKLFTVYKPT